MIQVIKRDGEYADFIITKIEEAIAKAFDATKTQYNSEIINLLALQVTAEFQRKIQEEYITVEDIQDSVETVLERAGYTEVAKAYILYRRQRERIRNMKSTIVDYKDVVNDYVQTEEKREKENSAENYSIGGLILSNSGAITKNYWLSEIYDEDIANAHRSGDIHIHGLSMLTGYSSGWSLGQLINEGLGGIPGRVSIAPAKHLAQLCNQMVSFLELMQNEWAAAQTFSSFDTYLAPFIKADAMEYQEVKRCMETFIYGVNIPSRWGTQPPFSHITFDWTVPEDLAEIRPVIGGVEMEFRYKDCQKEMDMLNRAFLEVMTEGDGKGERFQYPIPTYAITENFDWTEKENNRLLFTMAARYGTPYFANYVSGERKREDVRLNWEEIKPDFRELRTQGGGYFGAGEHTGSVGVVTVNLPRIAYLSESKTDFYKRLDRVMDLGARSLKIKRGILTKLLAEGMYPYTERYCGTFAHHFSTIGLAGMNEAWLNAGWQKEEASCSSMEDFGIEVLEHMKERLADYQEQYGDFYNLEATPAESAAYRFAKLDKKKYPDCITAGNGEAPFYTNSSQMPVDFTNNLYKAMDSQERLQVCYTGGTAFHIFLQEELPDYNSAASLVQKITKQYRLPYFTISPRYSVCEEHGYLKGQQFHCPVCGKNTEVYSRIAGFYSPVKNWNEGKKQEYRTREYYQTGETGL